MSSLQDAIKELGLEHLFEDHTSVTPDSIINQLNQSAKLDDVETQAYGLETDDGQIVKVYVNKTDADKFDEVMQRVLGETDNIEDAINLIAKEVDIVDVVWPQEQTDDSDVEGDESLNPEVYKNEIQSNEDSMIKKAQQTDESIVKNDKSQLDENASLESRFQTSNQKLIYHAIIALGVPEDVLLRTPLRAVLLHRIKEKAVELNRNTVLKQALKNIVRRSSEYLDDIPEVEKTSALGKLKMNTLDESIEFDNLLDKFMNIGPNSTLQEFLSIYNNVELYEAVPTKGIPVAMFVGSNKKQKFVLWQEGKKFILTSEQNANGEHLKVGEWNGKSFDAVVKELADKNYTKTPAKSYKQFEFGPVVESVIKAKFVNDEIELITNETSYFITESEANQLAYAFNSKKPTSIIIDDVQWIVSNRLNESVLKQKDSDVKLKLSQTIIDFIKNV